SSNTSCGEPRALLRSPELEGKARRALQPTGVQSAEKPSQLESENLTFRDENQALDTAKTSSSVPGTELPSKKWKTFDKENLPYFRIWKTHILIILSNPYEIHTNSSGLPACPSFRGTLKEPTQKSPNSLALEGRE
ncbi:hypothetical protein HID58_048551, partial [Brassica napus]